MSQLRNPGDSEMKGESILQGQPAHQSQSKCVRPPPLKPPTKRSDEGAIQQQKHETHQLLPKQETHQLLPEHLFSFRERLDAG